MIIKPNAGLGSVDDFTKIYGTVVGGSLFKFFQTKQELGIAQQWGFMPPYMAAYQAQQPSIGSSMGALVPIVLILGGAVVLIKVLKS